jgi:hypothetical protein
MPAVALRLTAAVAAGLAVSFPPPDVPRVFDQQAGGIPEFPLQLTAGRTEVFETVNLEPGTDPVLHLWDDAQNREVAADDNGGGGRAARLEVRITRSGDYTLIVRPRNFAAGRLDLRWNGEVWHDSVTYGTGRFLPLFRLQAREQVVSIAGPGGPPLHRVYRIADDAVRMQGRELGVPRAAWTVPGGAPAEAMLLFGVAPGSAEAPIRVYRNDALLAPERGSSPYRSDQDQDGLGYRLEAQLKTCAFTGTDVEGADCGSIADLRDTDGDALGDGWETIGGISAGRYLALPRWGADPRHKDMFVEVDYRRLTLAENAAAMRVTLGAAEARNFAAIYADAATTDAAERALHAEQVQNPDGKPGIAVHLDTGLPPAMPSDVAVYGDWSGYDAIDAVETGGVVDGIAPATLASTRMHPSRRGFFRYGPAHVGGGGQCGINDISCGYAMDSSNPAHEVGHSLGLDHAGPSGIVPLGANCKPNYPSVMNYAYLGTKDPLTGALFSLFSDGRGHPALNNVSLHEHRNFDPATPGYAARLRAVFGYLVDSAAGHVDWNRDGVFAPRGRTVRAYANSKKGGNCELSRMNQLVLTGSVADPEPASLAVTRAGRHTLLVELHGATVRYRRSASTFACATAESGCPGSSFGAPQALDFNGRVVGVDAEAVNIGGTYQISVVAIMENGLVKERRFALRADGELELGGTIWAVRAGARAVGEPSMAETRDGTGLYLAYKDATGAVWLHYRTGATWPAGRRATVDTPIAAPQPVVHPDGSPGLAHAWLPRPGGPSAELYMVLLAAADTTLRLYRLDAATGFWARSGLLDARPPALVGRTAMAWVPDSTGADQPGQFYIVGHKANADRTYVMLRTYFDTATSAIKVGMEADFDNSWLGGGSIDVTASASAGFPQLWAVLSRPGNPDEDVAPSILFRPRADGIVDLVYGDLDDWATMGWSLCTHTSAAAQPPSGVSRIKCRSRPY